MIIFNLFLKNQDCSSYHLNSLFIGTKKHARIFFLPKHHFGNILNGRRARRRLLRKRLFVRPLLLIPRMCLAMLKNVITRYSNFIYIFLNNLL